MVLHHIQQHHSLLNKFISEIRDIELQTDRMRFRRNVERIGEILAYELSRTLDYKPQMVTTPLGTLPVPMHTNEVVICSVLRAGIPLHQGLLNYFDSAENAFISAYRDHKGQGDDFEVVVNYLAAPSLEGKTLIIADPMLATGRTIENVWNILKGHGMPEQLHLVSVIGSGQGVAHVQNVVPDNTHLWIAAIDEGLDVRGYIIPGLGDAGDLCYGTKQ